ncbi:DUF4444 domain-containing protein [Seohaeicola saemankumensis]|nr:biotin/lipoate--protein ligase family protein [Seohaeicola saemankumensis]MCA0869848.1 DUF4444 domain-containing protein [Seohaeicola saemankumensis]
MTQTPSFPPLLQGEAVSGSTDPFDKARALAALGCDGGTVVYAPQMDRLRAAMVFAPDVALEEAMAMLPVCGIGFQNALGALAPPEVAVHLSWDGAIFVNGARCGGLRAAASGRAPDQVPDWLVIGLDVPFLWSDAAPGENPGVTVLAEEGCAELTPPQVLEAWARHTLVWINRWDDEGNGPVHAEWMGLLRDVGEKIDQGGHDGTFLGVDDRFGMLIRDSETTHLLPMSSLLQETP